MAGLSDLILEHEKVTLKLPDLEFLVLLLFMKELHHFDMENGTRLERVMPR